MLCLLAACLLHVAGMAQALPFAWRSDPLFARFEQQFIAARGVPVSEVEAQFDQAVGEIAGLMRALNRRDEGGRAGALVRLKELQFQMAFLAASHEVLLMRLQREVVRIRTGVMHAASGWHLDNDQLHDALYQVIYGGRAAVEEAWVQNRQQSLPALLPLMDAASATPSAMVEGVRIHSGDIVLSRAGSPVSALISRGNDYPGNFSHAALVYVDAETHVPTLIEALIEKGVAVTPIDQFFADKKQRMLLLRMRPDHPLLQKDPLLPHMAAAALFARVKAAHIDYDFAMNWHEERRFFCSEVPYYAYLHAGLHLWPFRTTMTLPGLRAWLGGMGVAHFTTLAPSDLEYDPDLIPVVEWRDSAVLMADRLDNVIMDALLTEAEHGLRLGYPFYKLPLAGLVKLVSPIQSLTGMTPTIPKGMSPETALHADTLVHVVYPVLRRALKQRTQSFLTANGYQPPYWRLLDMAEAVVREKKKALSPSLVEQATGR